MVDEQWNALTVRFPNIELDVYRVMPNHFHGILVVPGTAFIDASSIVEAQKKPTLGDIVGAFKSITTNEYIKGVDTKSWSQFYKRLWQRNYYEHVIRDEADLKRICDYIESNPANWDEDEENPKYRKS